MYRRAVVIDAAYQQLCREIGFEMNVVMENDEQDSIKELVKLGLGITFLPLWSVADEKRKGTLRTLRAPKPQFHNYGLLFRKADYYPEGSVESSRRGTPVERVVACRETCFAAVGCPNARLTHGDGKMPRQDHSLAVVAL